MQIALAAIVGFNAASLVFGWGNKGRDAAKRATEWATLDGDIEQAGERHFTEAQLNEWAARCNEIEAGEPAANDLLLTRAHLRACVALDTKPVGTVVAPSRWLIPLMVP